ncbi:MAG: glycosyltransferase, partial [Planctomycetes bacterium]|nr:glycosyltransferase [Planctomycetota bacterium]
GCHCFRDCARWRQGGCRECPQLGPSKSGGDLAAANFAAKRQGYADLDLHIVTPSVFLGKCVAESILFRDFPHTVIPNGFPLDELRPLDRVATRIALNLTPDRSIILFGADNCGNKNKGLHLLLEALPQLVEKWQNKPPVLVVFGIPSGIPPMPSGFECHVLGRLSGNSALSRAYSAANVFVLPSMEENLPNVIIEAQACGTPSVGFAIGGIPDIIAGPTLGRLAKPFDTADLADKIREVLMESPEEAAAARKDCRKHAEERYSQYAQTVAYLQLYRQLLGLPAIEPVTSLMDTRPTNESPASRTLVT